MVFFRFSQWFSPSMPGGGASLSRAINRDTTNQTPGVPDFTVTTFVASGQAVFQQPVKPANSGVGLLKAVALLLMFLILQGCSSRAPDPIKPTGLPDIDPVFSVQRLWSRNTGNGVGKGFLQLMPAVETDAITVASHDGRVERLENSRGSRLWRANTEDRISAGVYAGHDRVLYGTRDGEVVALAADDGSELWRSQLGSEMLSLPAADGLIAVFQTLDGRVVALDMDDGSQLWSFDTLVPVLILRGTATPVISEGKVFAAFANGKVFALDASTGNLIWERRVAEPKGRSELDRLVDINNNLIVQGGGVFASSFQGRVMVLDVDSGQPFWGMDMSTYGTMSSADGSLFVADSKGHVWAVDQRSGNDLWRQKGLEGHQLTGTAVAAGQVAVGDERGFIHWMDAETGQFTARQYHRRRGFSSPPVVQNDVFYVYGRRGQLSAYQLRAEGHYVWHRFLERVVP